MSYMVVVRLASARSGRFLFALLLAYASLGASQVINPNQGPIRPFLLDTTDAQQPFEYPGDSNVPVLFSILQPLSASNIAKWWDDGSILALLTNSTEDVRYVFLSYHFPGEAHIAEWQQSRFMSVMVANGFSEKQITAWRKRLYFIPTAVQKLKSAPFIVDTMTNWTTSIQQITYQDEKGNSIAAQRLDSRFPWLYPNPLQKFGNTTKVPIALYGGDICDGSKPEQNVTRKLALVERSSDPTCTFAAQVSVAQKLGALGVVVATLPGMPLVDMNCHAAECNWNLNIPATMITSQDGRAITKLLRASDPSSNVTVSFQAIVGPGENFAIDRKGRIQEMGMIQYPSFQFFVWEAEWFDWHATLEANVAAIEGTADFLAIDLWRAERYTAGWGGAMNQTNLIPAAAMHGLGEFSVAMLDAAINCTGFTDHDCPSWDRTLQLEVCCEGDSRCSSSSGEMNQLGRWTTPFRRRIGRWLTDVRPLLSILGAGYAGMGDRRCTYRASGIPTISQGYWVPSVRLLLAKKEPQQPKPTDYLRLWQGSHDMKNATAYAASFPTSSFVVPNGTKRVLLYAAFGGHGYAEFAPTHHVISLNGNPRSESVLNFNDAGTAEGCGVQAAKGVEPNEYGTWLYGRDGWCDGRNVFPHQYDVTKFVKPTENNVVAYRGGYNSPPSPPQSGNMDVLCYLVFEK